MVQTILLDLDNTLLDFNRAEANAIARAFQDLGLPAGEAVQQRYHEINRQQWERLERGEVTRDQLLILRFQLLFAQLGITADAAEACRRYEGYLAQGGDLLPGAKDLLEMLAGRYDLYLATNGAAKIQYSRIAAAGIGGCFQKVFISEEVGSHKPQLEFFQHCFAQIPGWQRETTWMVGDSLTSDILGGLRAGIHTCWVNFDHAPCPEEIQPDAIITALHQLPALLERW